MLDESLQSDYRASEAFLDASKNNPVATAPSTKSKIEEHFRPDFLELLKLAPKNPMTRGHIMRMLKQMPDASLDTFDKIKDWVEATFEPPPKGRPEVNRSGGHPQFSVAFDLSEVIRGVCRYSVRQNGSCTEGYNLDDIVEKINDGESIGEIISWMKDQCCSTQEVDFIPDEDTYTYSDFDSDYTYGVESSMSNGVPYVKRELMEWLQGVSPEAAEELENNG